MDAVNDFLIYIDGFLGSAIWFPTFLLATGIFFTLYLGFPQIRYFRHAIGVTTGKFDKKGRRATPPTSKPLPPRFRALWVPATSAA